MNSKPVAPWVWLLLLLTPLLASCGRTSSAPPLSPKPAWDTYSDTWVAVDGLGRAMPMEEETGPPKPNKTVGILYSLSLEPNSDGPYDTSKILAQHPEAMLDVHHPAWGPMNSSHHWGEPLFGYYANDDAWVLRKHAAMLANAGVDVVVFDNSNGATYDKARDALCRAWEDIRCQGGSTPQIAFLCPFGNLESIGTETLRTLYDTFYKPGRFSDLWFRWDGKPLILSDPYYATVERLQSVHHQPVALRENGSLGQTFSVAKPFNAVGGEISTLPKTESGMTLSLFSGGIGGKLVLRQSFAKVANNRTVLLESPRALAPGKYYLECSDLVGSIAWWSYVSGGNNGAYDGGKPTPGDRIVHVRYLGESDAQMLPSPSELSKEAAEKRSKELNDFFTFRTPRTSYDAKMAWPGDWAWLQVYPQTPQLAPTGNVEEVSVSVAQNYSKKTRLGPMSFPGAYGRSYHNGKRDEGKDAVRWGLNFAEEWNQAFKINPPFVFVTGWNEWTAGLTDHWLEYHSPPPILVDEFTEEYSRDIEPMRGGHGDDYYYQLVANVRRYKGARSLPAVKAHVIKFDGRFDNWKYVEPEFRDSVGDAVRRNSHGFGRAGPYVNSSGRNDIIAAKVSYDSSNVYFYVRTREKITPYTDPDWMLLYINSDADYKTGWLGYDFVVNRHPGTTTTSLERNVDGAYKWESVKSIPYAVTVNEMEIEIPIAALGIMGYPATIDFKWADHCYAKGDWTDFTLNGDAAPDDRFNYRAKLGVTK